MTATVLRGTPAYAAGKFGNALASAVLYETGIINGITGAQGADITASCTVEAFIKSTTAGTANRVAVGKDSLFWIGHDTTGRPYVSFGGSGTGGSVVSLAFNQDIRNDGQWHHLALVVDAGVVKLYFDGQLRNTGSSFAKYGATAPLDGVCLGGFNSNTTFDWVGQVDEVSISTAAKYTGSTYTVPTAPFASSRPAQVALYHLEADGTNSDTADVTPPTLGTISISHSGNTDTITYPAPGAGSAAVSGVALYEGTQSGQESSTPVATNPGTGAGSFTRPSASTGAKFYYARAYDANSIYSDATNEVAWPPPAVHDPTESGYLFSPGNWDITSARAFTNCAGAYVRTIIVGQLTQFEIRLDVTNIPAAGSRSILSYTLDGDAWVDVEVSSAAVVVTIPSAYQLRPKHSFEMVMRSSSTGVDRWNSPYVSAIKFLGIYLPSGVTLARPDERKLKGLCFGDSITEGIATQSSTVGDSKLGYVYGLGLNLGCEIGVIGYGGTGAVRAAAAGTGQVPPLTDSWNKQANGIARALPTDLDFIGINIGTNDQRTSVPAATFITALTALLDAIAAATSTKTSIIVLRPFGGFYSVANYQAAIAATTNPTRFDFVDTTGWWNSVDSPDTLHPYGYIHQTVLSPRTAAAVRAIINAGGQYVNVGGVATRISSQRR